MALYLSAIWLFAAFPACSPSGGTTDGGSPRDGDDMNADSGSQPADGGFEVADSGSSEIADGGGIAHPDGGIITTSGVSGTVMGVSLTVQSSVILDLAPDGGPAQANVYLLSLPNACDPDFGSGASLYRMDQTFLNLQLLHLDGSTLQWTTPIVGTYQVVQSGGEGGYLDAQAIFGTVCTPNGNQESEATSGSVTVTSLDLEAGGGAQGTFDLFFGTDEITGTFDSQLCQVGMPRPLCQ